MIFYISVQQFGLIQSQGLILKPKTRYCFTNRAKTEATSGDPQVLYCLPVAVLSQGSTTHSTDLRYKMKLCWAPAQVKVMVPKANSDCGRDTTKVV